MFFASLPFADEAGSYVEVGGEDGLAGFFAGAEVDLGRCPRLV
jgi:hypothetical protein